MHRSPPTMSTKTSTSTSTETTKRAMRETATKMLGGEKRAGRRRKENCLPAFGLTPPAHPHQGSFSWHHCHYYRLHLERKITTPVKISKIKTAGWQNQLAGTNSHHVLLQVWIVLKFQKYQKLQLFTFLTSAPFVGGDPTALGGLEDEGNGFTSCVLQLYSCSKSKTQCLLQLETCQQLLLDDQDLASSSRSSSASKPADESGDSKTPSLAEGAGKVPESELSSNHHPPSLWQ